MYQNLKHKSNEQKALWKLVIILFSLSSALELEADALVVSETWASCSVDQASLDQSSVMRISHFTSSFFECVALASGLPQIKLACHSVEQRGLCVLWETWAIIVGNVTTNPSLGLTPCKTIPLSEDDKDEFLQSTIPPFTTPGGTLSYTPEDCPGLFSMLALVGCIAVTSDKTSWDDARSFCLALEADLFSADNDFEFKAIMEFAKSSYNTKDHELWLGVQRNPDNEWRWLNGLNPDGQWYPFYPKENDCGFSYFLMISGLADADCGALKYGICRLR